MSFSRLLIVVTIVGLSPGLALATPPFTHEPAQAQTPTRKAAAPGKAKVAAPEKAELPTIEKISLQGPPLLFGGFSFYADRKGRVVVQSIKPSPGQSKTNYAETRTIVRDQPELFARLVDGLDLVALLSHPKGREFPVPEEITLTYELTLSNGVRISVRELANDKIKPLDDLGTRVAAARDAALKLQKPEKLDYEPKDFAAFEKILKVSSAILPD